MLGNIHAQVDQLLREKDLFLEETPEKVLDTEIGQAVKQTQGGDRDILKIEEEAAPNWLPSGTRAFIIESDHDVYEFHRDIAYAYKESIVILNNKDMQTITKDMIVRALKGEA